MEIQKNKYIFTMGLKNKLKNIVRYKQSLGEDGYIILNHLLAEDVKQVVLEDLYDFESVSDAIIKEIGKNRFNKEIDLVANIINLLTVHRTLKLKRFGNWENKK